MNNSIVIAAVSNLLKKAIQTELTTNLGGLNPRVLSLPPDKVESQMQPGDNLVNIFLYSVKQKLENRNLPTFISSGTILKNNFYLDLFYMVSFHGKDNFNSELMLGQTMLFFHKNPMFSSQLVNSSLSDLSSILGSSFTEELASKIASQLKLIRIIPSNVHSNTLEIPRLWESLGTKLRHSAFYEIREITLENE